MLPKTVALKVDASVDSILSLTVRRPYRKAVFGVG